MHVVFFSSLQGDFGVFFGGTASMWRWRGNEKGDECWRGKAIWDVGCGMWDVGDSLWERLRLRCSDTVSAIFQRRRRRALARALEGISMNTFPLVVAGALVFARAMLVREGDGWVGMWRKV